MTTKKQLFTFIGYAKQYVGKAQKERSILTFALQKFIDKYKKFTDEYQSDLNEKRSELEAKHCLKEKGTDAFIEKEVIVGQQVIFRKSFSADGDQKMKKEMDKYEEGYGSTTIDFTPYVVPVPALIDISWVKEFTGFVFNEMTEKEEQEWYLNQEEVKVDAV